MAKWINRAVANETTASANHTFTVPSTTAGNLLVAVVACGNLLSTPSGWVKEATANYSLETACFTKTAAGGETSFVFSSTGGTLPMFAAIYEFPAGTTWVGDASISGAATGAANPNLTGLTGTNFTFGIVSCYDITTGSTISCVWSGTGSPVEDFDINLDKGSVNGHFASLAYVEDNTASSFQPTGTLTNNPDLKEAITAAVNIPQPLTISLRAAGTATGATAAVTAVNPAVPSGATTGDLSVLTVWAKPYNTVITTPSGWTKIGEATNGTTASGTDTGSTIVAVYVKEDASVGAIGNITQSNANTMGAVINTYQKSSGSWNYASFTDGGDSTNAANYSATGAAGLDVRAKDWIVASTAVNGDVGTVSAQAIDGMSGATLGTVANRTNSAVTTGNDSRGLVSDVAVASGTSNAAPTFTYTNSSSGSGTTLWLRLRAADPDVNVNAVTATATATAPVPVIAVPATVTAPAATATALAPAPVVVGQIPGNVTAVKATASSTAVVPAVTAAATVTGVTATATATAIAPTVDTAVPVTVFAPVATAKAQASARPNNAINPQLATDDSGWISGGTKNRVSHNGKFWLQAAVDTYTYDTAIGITGEYYAASVRVNGTPGESVTFVSTDNVVGAFTETPAVTIPASGEIVIKAASTVPVAGPSLAFGVYMLTTQSVKVTDAVIEKVSGAGIMPSDAPAVGVSIGVTAVAATATSTAVIPVVTAAGTVVGVVATATSLAPAPTVGVSVTVTSPAATATALAPVPVVTTIGAVTAVAATATSVAPAPVVAAGAALAPPAATATALAPAPAVTTTASVAAVRAQGSSLAPAPVVTAAATVTGVAATATALAPAPVVGIPSGVTAVTATATATASPPVVLGTDPANLVVNISGGNPVLTWDTSSTAGVTTYSVRRRTGTSGAPIPVANEIAQVSALTYTDTTATNGTFEYQVYGIVAA